MVTLKKTAERDRNLLLVIKLEQTCRSPVVNCMIDIVRKARNHRARPFAGVNWDLSLPSSITPFRVSLELFRAAPGRQWPDVGGGSLHEDRVGVGLQVRLELDPRN